MFINGIYTDSNFYIEKDEENIIKFMSCESKEYTWAKKDDIFYIVYEDLSGNIIKLTIVNDTVNKEYVMISKTKLYEGRNIRILLRTDELIFIFTSKYNDKTLINIYTEKNGLYMFDECSGNNLTAETLKNDDIIIAYRKGVNTGYAVFDKNNKYVDFKIINSQTPVWVYEFPCGVFILCREKRYVLMNLSTNAKYQLPVVFGIRPEIIFKDNKIFLVYYKGKREIVYTIANAVISFYSEKILDCRYF